MLAGRAPAWPVPTSFEPGLADPELDPLVVLPAVLPVVVPPALPDAGRSRTELELMSQHFALAVPDDEVPVPCANALAAEKLTKAKTRTVFFIVSSTHRSDHSDEQQCLRGGNRS